MKGKQVLLTGGTGGLGLGVTPAILAQDAQLTLTYEKPEEVTRLKHHLSATDFARIRFIKADLSKESVVKPLIQDLGRVDVLIHLVGYFSMGKTEDFSLEDWQLCFDVNVKTTFLLCKYVLQSMRTTGYGRIVTIGSRGAVQPGAQVAAYCASKAAVVAFTQSLAQETKDLNITANTVLPSIIDTPYNRETMGQENAQQWVKPESLAEVICFLASEAAKEIRGAAIPVYGVV